MEHAVLDITMEDKNLWHFQLVKFLRDGVLPIDLMKSDKKAFKLKSSHFCILWDVLYRRGFNGILLRCLEYKDSQVTISCTHDGICEEYFSGPAIIKWLIHIGYYWPTMECDCIKYAKYYLKCQQHSNMFNQPS